MAAALLKKTSFTMRLFLKRAQQSALVRNATWLFAGQGLSFLIQGVYFIVLARLLGTAQYGLLAGAIALVAVVSQYSTLGSGLLFLRYVSPDHTRFGLYWGNILLSIGAMGGLLVLGLRCAGPHLVGRESVSLLPWSGPRPRLLSRPSAAHSPLPS